MYNEVKRKLGIIDGKRLKWYSGERIAGQFVTCTTDINSFWHMLNI